MVPTLYNSQLLQPGVYQIVNKVSGTVIDVAGHDNRSVIGYPAHNGPNQQWEFKPLGRGYSIRDMANGNYLTIEDGLRDGVHIVTSPYPVSWALEAANLEQGMWRIGWPNTPYIFDLADCGSSKPCTPVQLWTRGPLKDWRIWRLVRCKTENSAAITEPAVVKSPTTAPGPISSNAESSKLGDLNFKSNGEFTITTTTTTTTSVRKV